MSDLFTMPITSGEKPPVLENGVIGSDTDSRLQRLIDLRDRLETASDEWRACVARLQRGHAWFATHAPTDPRWPAAERLRQQLRTRLLRARIDGGNALLGYCAVCRALAPDVDLDGEWARWGVDPANPLALWQTCFPDPHTTAAAAADGSAPRLWWESRLGAPLPAREEARS